MKKILLYSLMLLSAVTFWSCKDDDNTGGSADGVDRLPRPMFIKDDNTGKGDSNPWNCTVVNINSASLYWYTIDKAVAYEIKWAVQNYVSGGEEAWNEAEQNLKRKSLDGHIVVSDPNQYHILLEHLQYQSDLRFAIRALNSFDKGSYPLYANQAGVYDILNSGDAPWKNDPKNSLWYGYGNGRQWADYLGLQTGARYACPKFITLLERTDNSMRIGISRELDLRDYTEAELSDIREHFHFLDGEEKMIVKVDYMTFRASYSTPTATENPTFVHYDLTEEDWERGYVDVTDLSPNSVYDIYLWDKDVEYEVDAWVDANQKHTTGPVGPEILIEHVPTPQATQVDIGGAEISGDISSYNSMRLDDIFTDYNTSIELAENQVFYLEGGKTYHLDGNVDLYKGFTLRTDPKDVAQGKRAKLLLSGMLKVGGATTQSNFMMGRQPASSENPTITLDIDSVRFIDLDVDCPLAQNKGGEVPTGNYFMNMYSNGMGISIAYLEWNNCTFQGLIRGFFRTQGTNNFFCKEMKMIDCEFYNCGYYSADGSDYAYLYLDHNGKPKSNLAENIEITGNVFYNNPKRALIHDVNRDIEWDASVRWNINVHHNTFVNFNPYCTADQSAIFYLTTFPSGSVMGFHDNVYILTKEVTDAARPLQTRGFYVNRVKGGDGTGRCTFDIYNNWTTDDSDVWTGGKLFASRAIEATSNAPGQFYQNWGEDATTYFPYGQDELAIKVDKSLKAIDLMESPNPKYKKVDGVDGVNDYHTDNGIDGLYYKQNDVVFNSDIYKSGAGAPKLRNGK